MSHAENSRLPRIRLETISKRPELYNTGLTSLLTHYTGFKIIEIPSKVVDGVKKAA